MTAPRRQARAIRCPPAFNNVPPRNSATDVKTVSSLDRLTDWSSLNPTGSFKIGNMVRKGAILFLSSAAILTAVIGVVGFSNGVFMAAPGPGKIQGYLHSADGLIRLYVFVADEPIYFAASNQTRDITVRRATDGSPCLSFNHGIVPGVTPYKWYWGETSFNSPNSPSRVQFNGIRTRVAAPVAMFLGYPVFTIWRERRRRRRRRPGCCVHCLYDLTGNESGVCPECGTAIASLSAAAQPST